MQNITTQEIAVGEPVQNKTMTKVKENFESLDARLSSAENGGNTVYPPIIMALTGSYGEPGDFDVATEGLRALRTTLNFNLIVTGVRLIIDDAGISGVTEVDLKYRRAGGIYTSIFSTRPSVSYTEGNDAISSNAVVNEDHNLLEAGDILSMDVISVQNRAVGCKLRIDYVKV